MRLLFSKWCSGSIIAPAFKESGGDFQQNLNESQMLTHFVLRSGRYIYDMLWPLPLPSQDGGKLEERCATWHARFLLFRACVSRSAVYHSTPPRCASPNGREPPSLPLASLASSDHKFVCGRSAADLPTPTWRAQTSRTSSRMQLPGPLLLHSQVPGSPDAQPRWLH